jgi:hypothetical protein
VAQEQAKQSHDPILYPTTKIGNSSVADCLAVGDAGRTGDGKIKAVPPGRHRIGVCTSFLWRHAKGQTASLPPHERRGRQNSRSSVTLLGDTFGGP